MTNKVAFFALVSVLVAAAAGCSGSSPSLTVGGGESSSPAAPAANAAGTSAVAQPSVATSTASGSAHATSGKTTGSDVITFPKGGAASVSSWYHGRGGAEFTSLTKTLNSVSQAKAKGGLQGFAGTCGQMKSAAQAAQAGPPIPLASAAALYNAALTGYVKSATDCQQASAAGNTGGLNTAAKEVDANSVTLNRAAAVIIAALSTK
jgi:hypothetical protein